MFSQTWDNGNVCVLPFSTCAAVHSMALECSLQWRSNHSNDSIIPIQLFLFRYHHYINAHTNFPANIIYTVWGNFENSSSARVTTMFHLFSSQAWERNMLGICAKSSSAWHESACLSWSFFLKSKCQCFYWSYSGKPTFLAGPWPSGGNSVW